MLRRRVNDGTDSLAKLLAQPHQSNAGTSFKNLVTKTVARVAESATLADAKAAMEATPNSQDVIVTATGKNNAPMLGWISNVDIARLSQP